MKAALPHMAFAVALSLAACRETPVEPEAEARPATPSMAAAASSWLTELTCRATALALPPSSSRTPRAGRLCMRSGAIPHQHGPVRLGGTEHRTGLQQRHQHVDHARTATARAPVLKRCRRDQRQDLRSGGASGYKNYSDELFVYDPAANTWTQKQPMPRNTIEGTSAAIDGKLFVLSSCHQQEDCWNPVFPDVSFYRYDPATDQWTELPSPRSQHPHIAGVAGAIGKKIYVVGGTYQGDNVLEVYDPATNAWSTRVSMGSVRSRSAGAAVNGKLYVIAGYANGQAVPPPVSTTPRRTRGRT